MVMIKLYSGVDRVEGREEWGRGIYSCRSIFSKQTVILH